MELKFYKSESSVMPELVDDVSSKKVTYIRQNVVEKQRTDGDGESYTYYEYEEAKMTKEEYAQYLQELKSNDMLEKVKSIEDRVDVLEKTVVTENAMADAILEGVNEV